MRKNENRYNRYWHLKEEVKWAQVRELLGQDGRGKHINVTSRYFGEIITLYAELPLYFAQKMFKIYQFATCIVIVFINLHITYKNNLQV